MLTVNDTHSTFTPISTYIRIQQSKKFLCSMFESLFANNPFVHLIFPFTTATTATCLHILKIRHKKAHYSQTHSASNIQMEFVRFFRPLNFRALLPSTFAVPSVALFFHPNCLHCFAIFSLVL